MTTVLADTQNVLWAAGATHPKRRRGLCRLDRRDGHQSDIGKRSLTVPASELCEQLGFRLVALTPADCQRMGAIPLLHRDPFDRLLIAQALEQELTLITADHSIWDYPEVDLIRNP